VLGGRYIKDPSPEGTALLLSFEDVARIIINPIFPQELQEFSFEITPLMVLFLIVYVFDGSF
jgi:hypothetical protein